MSERLNIGQVVNSIKTDGLGSVNDLKSLAQSEIKPIAANAKKAGISFGVAAGAAIPGLLLLVLALAFGLSKIFNGPLHRGWAISLLFGFGTLALLFLIVAGIAGAAGAAAAKKLHGPDKTIAEAKATVNSLKASITRGQETVTANELARIDIAEAKKEAKHLTPAQEYLRRTDNEAYLRRTDPNGSHAA